MRTVIAFLFLAASLCAQTAIRVNAGGPNYVDKAGNTWAADTAAPNSFTTTTAIAGTSDQTLYQTEAWASGTLEYKFQEPNGTYNVTLKFAEIYFNAAAQRVFNIVINGQTVQTNFDPFVAAGGANTAADRTYPVTVLSGAIDIQLQSVVQNPKISAIDIEPVAPAPPDPGDDPNTDPTVTTPADIAWLRAKVAYLAYELQQIVNSKTTAP
jgi:hypothetical protein